jgi:hypothetical protein
MDWKTVLTLLLSFMLVFSVFAGCTQNQDDAVENVRSLVEKLPSVEEFEAMDQDGKLAAYTATQSAYDAFMALTDKQQEQLTKELAVMETLFQHFNSLIMPIA